MAVPKKRKSQFKVNLHQHYGYFNVQKFYKYRGHFNIKNILKDIKKKEFKLIPYCIKRLLLS